jgi:hypothetical protein
MATNTEIAEALLAVCLKADHKPGKVQFTKYLYLLDYCHWHLTGRKATAFPWRFYHYGPWCEEVEACMAGLAERYQFGWREEEAAIVRSIQVAVPRLDITIKSLIGRIVEMFKNRDRNVLLEVAYSQTEPMVRAQRGDALDFSVVPVDRELPNFFPEVAAPATDYQIHPKRREEMEAFRAKAAALREKARQRMVYRESESYQKALALVAEEFAPYGELPPMRGNLSLEAANGLGRE